MISQSRIRLDLAQMIMGQELFTHQAWQPELEAFEFVAMLIGWNKINHTQQPSEQQGTLTYIIKNSEQMTKNMQNKNKQKKFIHKK